MFLVFVVSLNPNQLKKKRKEIDDEVQQQLAPIVRSFVQRHLAVGVAGATSYSTNQGYKKRLTTITNAIVDEQLQTLNVIVQQHSKTVQPEDSRLYSSTIFTRELARSVLERAKRNVTIDQATGCKFYESSADGRPKMTLSEDERKRLAKNMKEATIAVKKAS